MYAKIAKTSAATASTRLRPNTFQACMRVCERRSKLPAQQIGDALLQIPSNLCTGLRYMPVASASCCKETSTRAQLPQGLRTYVALHGENTQEDDLITERTMAPTVMANASIFSILNPPPRCTGAPFDPCMNFAGVRLHGTATKWRHKRLKKHAQEELWKGHAHRQAPGIASW